MRLKSIRPWITVHNPATPPEPAPPPTPIPEPTPPTLPPNPPEEEKPTLSQKKVNALLAQERKKLEESNKKTIEQLEALQKSKSLSDREKEGLTNQIEELKNAMLTKEQLAMKEREKLEKEAQEKVRQSQDKAEKTWKLYEESMISRTITDAAVKLEAFNPKQIVTVLERNTALVEDKDEQGTGLGTYTPRVKFPDTKDGAKITLDLTAEEAVKRMKDLPEEYGNLFKAGVAGGLGGKGGTGGVDNSSGPPTDPERYRAWREKQRKQGNL